MDRPFIYWVNPNRPEMQYRTNTVSCWQRKVGEEEWRYFEGLTPTWPCTWRFQVTLAELDENREIVEKA